MSLDHAFSAREVYAAAKARQPSRGLSAAYRAIDRWHDQELVEDAGVRSGEAVYRLCSSPSATTIWSARPAAPAGK